MNPLIRINRSPRRRGSAYAFVVMTAMIVTVLGLSAIALSRIEQRKSREAASLAAARAAARAAIEWGLVQIRTETTWSNISTRPAAWATNVALGNATYSLSRTAYDATDPINPRLTLRATGNAGGAQVIYDVVIIRGAWIEANGWTQVVN